MKSSVTDKNSYSAVAVDGTLAAIRDVIAAATRVLVVSHVDPDGDAIGTTLAVADYCRSVGAEIIIVRQDDIPGKYRFLAGVDQIKHVDDIPGSFSVDTATVLECPKLERAGRAAKFLRDGVRIVNIDHHPDNRIEAEVSWLDPGRSSVGEMVYDFFQAVGYAVKPEAAEQLYTAIMTDTGQFRFTNTSPRTMVIAGELIAAGAAPKKISDHVYYNLPVAAMRLLGTVLSGIKFYDDDRVCLLTLTKEMLANSGARMSDTEGLVDFTLFSAGVDSGALLRELDDGTTKVSLRSRNGVNVSRIARFFGGGGHVNAAGCKIAMPLDAAREELLKMFHQAREERCE